MASSSSPSGLGRVPFATGSRSDPLQGRRSGEIVGGIAEEEEEEDDLDGGFFGNAIPADQEDDEKWEELGDQFGPELRSPGALTEETLTPPVAALEEEDEPPDADFGGRTSVASTTGSVPLTHEALAQKDAADLGVPEANILSARD